MEVGIQGRGNGGWRLIGDRGIGGGGRKLRLNGRGAVEVKEEGVRGLRMLVVGSHAAVTPPRGLVGNEMFVSLSLTARRVCKHAEEYVYARVDNIHRHT